MKKLFLLGLMFGLVLIPVFVKAEDAVTPKSEVVVSDTLVEVGNKICPVSGEKIGGMGKGEKYEYNGKIYNLCCGMCSKDFKKDPDKYAKTAEAEVKAEETATQN